MVGPSVKRLPWEDVGDIGDKRQYLLTKPLAVYRIWFVEIINAWRCNREFQIDHISDSAQNSDCVDFR